MASKKLGRPSKYKKEYCDMLKAHMAQGLSYESFAAMLETHRDTLYEWEKVHSDFSDAKKIGKEKMLLLFEKMGVQAMAGKIKGFNASTYIFTMKNKCGWSDKSEKEITAEKENLKLIYNLNADSKSN